MKTNQKQQLVHLLTLSALHRSYHQSAKHDADGCMDAITSTDGVGVVASLVTITQQYGQLAV